jgi:hypothetical protein
MRVAVAALTDGGALLFLDVDTSRVVYRITLPPGCCPLVHFSMDAAANSLMLVTADGKVPPLAAAPPTWPARVEACIQQTSSAKRTLFADHLPYRRFGSSNSISD